MHVVSFNIRIAISNFLEFRLYSLSSPFPVIVSCQSYHGEQQRNTHGGWYIVIIIHVAMSIMCDMWDRRV